MTIKTNVSYVGDLVSALDEVAHDRRIIVETPETRRLTISEITINEDGAIVLYLETTQ